VLSRRQRRRFCNVTSFPEIVFRSLLKATLFKSPWFAAKYLKVATLCLHIPRSSGNVQKCETHLLLAAHLLAPKHPDTKMICKRNYHSQICQHSRNNILSVPYEVYGRVKPTAWHRNQVPTSVTYYQRSNHLSDCHEIRNYFFTKRWWAKVGFSENQLGHRILLKGVNEILTRILYLFGDSGEIRC